MRKVNFFLPILAFVGISLLFIFSTSTLEASKMVAQWNFNLYAVIGAVILFYLNREKSLFKEYFSATSLREVTDRFAVGIVWGAIGLFTINYVLRGIVTFHDLVLTNLFGSVPPTFLASITREGAVFTVLIQPFSETLLIGAAILLLFSFLKRAKVPYPMFSALAIVALMFSSFHFVSQGKLAYEQSLIGYLNYLGDIEGYGKDGKYPSEYPDGVCPEGTKVDPLTRTCKYTGGLPLLLLGLFWGGLFIVYKNFLEPAGAHTFNNFIALFLTSGLSMNVQNFINALGLFFLLVVAFSIWKGQFGKFFKFNLKELLK
ncbi:MAG: CPBP family glutamic-type intramembrane protease [Candidatus Heimdallarchaeaceae archaeon]